MVNLSGRVKQIAKEDPVRTGLACGAAALVLMLILVIGSSSAPTQPVVQTLDLPPSLANDASDPSESTLDPSASPLANPAVVQAAKAAPVILHNEQWKTVTVRSRDTYTRLFKRLWLNAKQLHDLLAFAKKTPALNQFKAGQTLRVLIDTPQHQLKQLDYPLNILDVLSIKQGAHGFTSTVIHRKPVITLKYATNTVRSSLAAAARKVGLSNSLISQLGSIFAADTGFAKNVHPGDKFCLLYEAFYLDGKNIGTGNILEAEVTTKSKVYRALRYTSPKGDTNYYTPQGQSLQRAFIRNPIKYSHISSLFSFNRYHPLLHFARAHQGVDFAAPRGTPVKATGDGKITFMGYKGSYGNAIVLNHGGAYSTLYGHMQHFAQGLHQGAYVHQKQVIGYVGSTGLASGPHLHYEFLVNGVHRDPLTVPLPSSRPIAPSYRAEFLSKAKAMMAKLAVYRQQS